MYLHLCWPSLTWREVSRYQTNQSCITWQPRMDATLDHKCVRNTRCCSRSSAGPARRTTIPAIIIHFFHFDSGNTSLGSSCMVVCLCMTNSRCRYSACCWWTGLEREIPPSLAGKRGEGRGGHGLRAHPQPHTLHQQGNQASPVCRPTTRRDEGQNTPQNSNA